MSMVALSCFCACSSDFVFLELPAPAGAQTVWFSVVRRSDPSDAVYALSSVPPFQAAIEGADALTLSYFSESVEELGLSEGRVEQASDDSCNRREPPAALAAFQLVDDQLQPIDRDPLRSRDFVYELPCPCKELDITLVPLPVEARIHELTALGARRALVVTRGANESATLLVYDDVTGTLVETATSAGFAGGCTNGEAPAYLAGFGESFSIYDEASGLRSGPDAPAGTRIEDMVCAPKGAPSEVFGLDRSGRVHRFDGDAWTTPYDRETSVQNEANLASITWVEPERAVFMAGNGSRLVYLEGDRSTEISWGPEQTISPTRGGVRQLLHTDSLGLLMLTRASYLLVDENLSGTWENLTAPPPGEEQSASFESMTALGDGLLVASEQAGIREYNKTLSRFCDAEPIGGSLNLSTLSRIDDDLYLAGGVPVRQGDLNQLVVIHLR